MVKKKSGQLGAQLHRVVVMFSLLAAAPAIVVLFGAIFFHLLN